MELEEAKKMGLELMETSKAAYLTTIDNEGFPITRAIFNLKNKEQFPEFSRFFQKQSDEFLIFISTNTSSSKTVHIKKNPAICVYYCDSFSKKDFRFYEVISFFHRVHIHLIVYCCLNCLFLHSCNN